MRKDLILGLGSMEERTQYSQCTLQCWTTTLNSHNLGQLTGPLQFLPNTTSIIGHSLNIYHQDHGLDHLVRQYWGGMVQRPWLLHLVIIIMLVRILPLLYTCILLTILVTGLKCRSSILMNSFTNLFYRYYDLSLVHKNLVFVHYSPLNCNTVYGQE